MNPFTTYILKVAGRCNLNCSYCYMYNLFDQSWIKQPKVMNRNTWNVAGQKIAEYSKKYGINEIHIAIHGGEPLLLGQEMMTDLFDDLNDIFNSRNIKVDYGMQTNGTLVTEEWVNLLAKYSVGVGISIDGDEHTHDERRLDHAGKGSYERVKEGLRKFLATDKGMSTFKGVLSVININSDPRDIIQHFIDLGITDIDFLLPDNNHDNLPNGKSNFEDISYANWLIKAFDFYIDNEEKLSIRIFDTLIALIMGIDENLDAFGCSPINIAVIETNGDITPLDVFKASIENNIGANILINNLDDEIVYNNQIIQLQWSGFEGLNTLCKNCANVNVCGGGYLPHRYSNKAGFNNSSIYCRDLYMLIEYIKNHIARIKTELLKIQYI